MIDGHIGLTDDAGNAILYRRYAARIPDFLAKYAPKEGYRVESTMTDLSLQWDSCTNQFSQQR